jgi:hypothetical protein
MVKVGPAISALLERIEADPDLTLQTEGVPEFIDGIATLARNGKNAVASLQGFSTSFDQTAKLSRALRPPIRDIQNGLRGFVDAQHPRSQLEQLARNGTKTDHCTTSFTSTTAGSRHAIAGKLVNRVSQNALLRSLSLSSPGTHLIPRPASDLLECPTSTGAGPRALPPQRPSWPPPFNRPRPLIP